MPDDICEQSRTHAPHCEAIPSERFEDGASASETFLPKTLPPPPPENIAFHEASHAVVGMAFGMRVLGIAKTKTGAACHFLSTEPAPAEHETVKMLLAGPIGERWANRMVWYADEASLRPHIDAARRGERGRCDYCRTFTALLASDPSRTDAQLIGRYRELEAEAVSMVRRPDIWRGICRIADEYKARGVLSLFDDVFAEVRGSLAT